MEPGNDAGGQPEDKDYSKFQDGQGLDAQLRRSQECPDQGAEQLAVAKNLA